MRVYSVVARRPSVAQTTFGKCLGTSEAGDLEQVVFSLVTSPGATMGMLIHIEDHNELPPVARIGELEGPGGLEEYRGRASRLCKSWLQR